RTLRKFSTAGFGEVRFCSAERPRVGRLGLSGESSVGCYRFLGRENAVASTDDEGVTCDDGAGALHHFCSLDNAAAGGDDGFCEKYAFAWLQGETAAKFELSVGAFGEDIADAEGTGELVAQYNSAKSR